MSGVSIDPYSCQDVTVVVTSVHRSERPFQVQAVDFDYRQTVVPGWVVAFNHSVCNAASSCDILMCNVLSNFEDELHLH